MEAALGSSSPVGRSPLDTAALAHALGIDHSPSELAAVDHLRVRRIAEHLKTRQDFREFSPAAWDDEKFWNVADPPALRSQFFAIGNSINFRFWRLRGAQVQAVAGQLEGEKFRGSMYMWRCLRRALDREDTPLLDPEFLARLRRTDFRDIFADDFGQNPLDVAAGARLWNLRCLGRCLIERWDGSFFNVVAAASGSLVEFARLSSDFRAFDDPLYKLTMVNAILHSGSGVADFSDEPLPAIDYHLLKQALRQGMVCPRADLAGKLRTSGLLTATEAFELRRATLLAFVELAELTGVSGEIIDNQYWLNRVNCTDTDPVCLDPSTAGRCPFFRAGIQATGYALPLELTRYY